MTADNSDNRHPTPRPSIRVVFDARSGGILEAHHGGSHAEPADVRPSHGEPGVAQEHRDAIVVPTDELKPGARYRVDPTARSLVATDDELGVGFGAGPTGRSR